MAVTTRDGVRKKKGEVVWERAWLGFPEITPLVPDQSIVGKTLADPKNCWDNYENCMTECRKYNVEHQLKKPDGSFV